jgi:hypothetical protein
MFVYVFDILLGIVAEINVHRCLYLIETVKSGFSIIAKRQGFVNYFNKVVGLVFSKNYGRILSPWKAFMLRLFFFTKFC